MTPDEGRAPSAAPSIPVIEGVDTAAALVVLMGRRQLYLNLLRIFVRNYGGHAEQLRAAVAARRMDAAAHQCHTLVSVAATLGAHRLCALGRALQAALAAGAGVPPALNAFADEYVRQHARIGAALAGLAAP